MKQILWFEEVPVHRYIVRENNDNDEPETEYNIANFFKHSESL